MSLSYRETFDRPGGLWKGPVGSPLLELLGTTHTVSVAPFFGFSLVEVLAVIDHALAVNISKSLHIHWDLMFTQRIVDFFACVSQYSKENTRIPHQYGLWFPSCDLDFLSLASTEME